MEKEKNLQKEAAETVDLQSKSRLLAFLLGIFIGLAVIVPGVSGFCMPLAIFSTISSVACSF